MSNWHLPNWITFNSPHLAHPHLPLSTVVSHFLKSKLFNNKHCNPLLDVWFPVILPISSCQLFQEPSFLFNMLHCSFPPSHDPTLCTFLNHLCVPWMALITPQWPNSVASSPFPTWTIRSGHTIHVLHAPREEECFYFYTSASHFSASHFSDFTVTHYLYIHTIHAVKEDGILSSLAYCLRVYYTHYYYTDLIFMLMSHFIQLFLMRWPTLLLLSSWYREGVLLPTAVTPSCDGLLACDVDYIFPDLGTLTLFCSFPIPWQLGAFTYSMSHVWAHSSDSAGKLQWVKKLSQCFDILKRLACQ